MLRAAALPAVLVALAALLAPAPSGGVGTPRCSAGQLRISVLDVQGATSHSYWDIALRNAGPGSCRLRGYPGVGLLDARGRPIADEVRREPGFPTPSVTVASGRRAYFTFGYVVAGPCLPHAFKAYRLEVYPPDERGRLLLDTRAPLEVCDRSVGGPPVVYPIRASPAVG